MSEPSPDPDTAADVAIVGGGIVALSLAWEFIRREPTCRIALIAPRPDSSSASRAAGAMLSGFGETTHLSRQSNAGRTKVEWRLHAARLWASWASELAERSGVEIGLEAGTIVIANAVSGDIDQRNFLATTALLDSKEEPYHHLDPVRDLGLRPSTADRPMQAILIPGERYVDTGQVLHALRLVVSATRSVQWLDADCTGVRPSPQTSASPPFVLVTTRGTLQANRVVIAAGAGSVRLLEGFPDIVRRIPPLLHGAGSAVLCASNAESDFLPAAVRTPNRAFACGLHALPIGAGRYYLGATNNVQVSASAEAIVSDLGFIIESAVHQIDRRLASCAVKEIRVGNRPVSADTYPLVGETTPGLWLVAGTYRDGFLMAPLLAARVFDALASGASFIGGGRIFAPMRPPIPCADRESAVQECVDNFLAIAYERRARLPSVGPWEEDFRSSIEQRVRGVYDSMGAVVPPDFLWDVAQQDLHQLLCSYYAKVNEIWRSHEEQCASSSP